jgi:predicted transcriptional regulator
MLTIDVAPLSEALDSFAAAFDPSKRSASPARISFASPELLWKVLTPERWEVLRAMTGAGPLRASEIAQRISRDPETVAADVRALRTAGVLDAAPDDCVSFPFDAIHVDFVLKAA